MPTAEVDAPPGPPPEFEDARTRRQKARSAGMDPNHWYAVEQSRRLPRGQVIETKFWGRSIAVFRGDDGRVRALENRCAHRSVELTTGEVEGCRLTCPYHGWSYDDTGLAHIPHELYGAKDPQFRVGALPAEERYGLIFVFPGDPERAAERTIPRIPELDSGRGWTRSITQFDCDAHHSMLLDNVSDFTHGFLHRKYEPFRGTRLLRLESFDDRVELEYESKVAANPWQDAFITRTGSEQRLFSCYDYPYHWTIAEEGRIRLYTFVLPRDERTNRHFYLLYMSPDSLSFPGLRRWRLPFVFRQIACNLAQRFYMQPLFLQDVWALELEQRAWDRHWNRPAPEISPVVHAFEDLTIRKWQEYLAGSDSRDTECRPQELVADAAGGQAAGDKPR